MKQLGWFVVLSVSVALSACGGETQKKASTALAAKKAPDARMTQSLAGAARTRSMPAGARPADPRGLQLGGRPVGNVTAESLAWIVSEDLDGDRRAEEILVVLDAASETVYLLWQAALDDCAADAGYLAAIERTGAFSVLVGGTCEDENLLAGCDFDARGDCLGCGVCSLRQGALSCAATDACE